MSKRDNKIYVLIATSPENLGDLLINKMLVEEVAKYGDVYIDAAGIPEHFKKYLLQNNRVYDFEKEYSGSLKRLSALKVLPIVKKDFQYFFRSPGPIVRIGNRFKSIINKLSISLTYRYLYINSKTKLNLVGNDISLKSKFDIWIEKQDNKYLSNCFLRTHSNVLELKAKGISNVDYIPDLAFLYNNTNDFIDKHRILISFRETEDSKYRALILDILNKIIPYFNNQNKLITFFYQVEEDQSFNKFLYNQFQSFNTIFIENCIWFDEISLYNESKYVISNRMHVLLLGLLHTAVPLSILNTDDNLLKIIRILSDFVLQDLSIDTNSDLEKIDLQYLSNLKKIQQIITYNKTVCQDQIASIFTAKSN